MKTMDDYDAAMDRASLKAGPGKPDATGWNARYVMALKEEGLTLLAIPYRGAPPLMLELEPGKRSNDRQAMIAPIPHPYDKEGPYLYPSWIVPLEDKPNENHD